MNTRDIDTNDTGLPMPGREHDPPRSQALEVPAPVANQTLTAAPDLVERLSRAATKAILDKSLPGGATEKAVRAVLSELANMAHADALPTVQAYAEELLGECGQHVPMPAWDDLDPARQACFRDMTNAARNLALAALAAKDATIAEQKRTIEVQTACIVAVVSERDAALAEVARMKEENDINGGLAQKLGELGAMLNVLGLPDEPKALAREIAERYKNAADIAAKVAKDAAETLNAKALDAATKEAEALRKRVRILEIAPRAAHYANERYMVPARAGDANEAVNIIERGSAEESPSGAPWAKAVLEYAAREGLT